MNSASIDSILDGVMDVIPLPKSYLRLRELLQDVNSSLDEITKVISNDPGLTSRILRLANSAQFARISGIDTVSGAVQLLGLNQVHHLALASAATGSLSHLAVGSYDLHRHWRKSIYAAVVARIVARRMGIRGHERLFVAGLLHAVGELVLAFKAPDTFAGLQAEAARDERAPALVQREHLGFDYAEVSAGLLDRWQLPADLVLPVRHHAAGFSAAPEECRADTCVLQVAAVLARAALWRAPGDEPVPDFEPVALVVTELDEEGTEQVMSEADAQVIEAMGLLLPSLKPGQRSAADA